MTAEQQNDQLELAQLQRALRQQMESLQRAGVQQMGRVPDAPYVVSPPVRTEAMVETQGETALEIPAAAAQLDPMRQLQALACEVQRCTLCHELATSRTQTVFGTGNPRPRLCFLGEAPGADEDAQGEPFVGAAGRLLNDILRACTLKREDVYILNVLKCRPPKNRTPEAGEVEHCRPFFERQLTILQPEFICCLGSVASNALLQQGKPLGQLRGNFFEWRGSRVLVTYHPAYLLRNPAAKRDVWADMKRLMHEMGIVLPE